MWDYRGQTRPPFAEPPGPGQESVWDFPRPPRVDEDSRHVVVAAGGVTIADTRAALRVCETASPPTFYVPASDVDADRLVVATGRSFCEWKGEACYYSLVDDPSRTVVAWAYPDPSPSFVRLADHFAFYPGRVACFVDGEHVRPQPGEFYGGWITDDVVGPFKGEASTRGW